jgi:hypothetical protein
VIFHDRLLPQIRYVPGPQPEWKRAVPVQESVDRVVRRLPQTGDAPAPRRCPDIGGIGFGPECAHIDEIPRPSERLMRPRVGGEQ